MMPMSEFLSDASSAAPRHEAVPGKSSATTRDALARRVLFAIDDHRWISAENASDLRIRPEGAPFQIVWLKGHGRFKSRMGGRFTSLRPGTIWTSAKSAESARLHLEVDARSEDTPEPAGLVLSFAAPLAADYANYLARQFGSLAHLPANSRAMRAMHALSKALVEKEGPEAISRRVFNWFAALHETLEERRMHLHELLSGKTDRLPDIFETHGHTIKGLAEYLACSPAWLRQRLARSWKQPAGDLLKVLRREHAWKLLADPSLGIGEVARRCGFADVSSFASSFKRETGLTPSRARRMAPERKGEPVAIPQPTIRKTVPGDPPPSERTYSPAAVWGGAFFQFDGGVSALAYDTPFDLALNTITNTVHWVLTLEGEAVFEAGNHVLRVVPGMVVVYPQPMNGRWLTPHGGRRPWKRLWLSVRCQWGIEALLALGAAHGWAAMVPLDSMPVKLARKSAALWHAHRNEPSIACSRAGFEWLQSWWELLCSGKVTEIPGADRAALPDLRGLLSKSFFRQIKTIGEFARQLGYSRRHATRKLRTQWDDGTPAQVIRRQRLAQAALDLRHTRLSVEEIARKAQYASRGAFIPAFKREFNMTPLAYRLAGM